MTMSKDKKSQLNLRAVLRAIDHRDRKYLERLTAEERALYKAYTMMRYASSVHGDQAHQEYYIEMVNKCVNKHFWALNKHPELQWLLTAMVGSGHEHYHPWLPPLKSKNKEVDNEE